MRRSLCSPRAELRLVGALLERDAREGRGAVVAATLTGDATSRGRFQHGESGGEADGAESLVVRRWTGGRETLYGEGIASISVVAPSAVGWLDEVRPPPGERWMNRYVRGLLAGLRAVGLRAVYPGRDFVTVSRRRVAAISAERARSGAFLFQAILGVDTPYSVDSGPPRAGLPPAPATRALRDELGGSATGESVLDAIVEGYRQQLGLEWTTEEPGADEGPLPAEPDVAGLLGGGVVAIPVGDLEAFCALDAHGRFERVRLVGDWIAGSADVAALESSLVGEPASAERVAPIVEDWLARPDTLAIGLVHADLLVRAILASVGRAQGASLSSTDG